MDGISVFSVSILGDGFLFLRPQSGHIALPHALMYRFDRSVIFTVQMFFEDNFKI